MNTRARKRFGQNFLQDQCVIEQIVKSIHPKPGDHIVEIGPGLGALTTHILPLVGSMDAIELDRDLIPELAAECAGLGKLNIHSADVLSYDFSELSKAPHSLRVVGNLPYNISSPLLFHVIEYLPIIKDMHFMLQKELVERMAASVNNKDYGRLTIMLQYHCDITLLFYVSATAFWPVPKVESAVVRLVPKTPSLIAENMDMFAQVVKQAFSHRRKILRNCLQGLVDAKQLERLEIDSNARPEQLTVDDFVRISNAAL
jgi:16S rRNA (adenine1518-N6/adenine1519-N6)-dimethyltransferase